MNRLTYIGLAITLVMVFAAIFAPLVAPQDFAEQDLAMRYQPISSEHIFGTDSLGRDVFARVVYGARISLQVGIVVVVVSTIVGTILGSLAGFYGGWIDNLLSGYIFNVFL